MKYHNGANAEYNASNYIEGFGSRAELGWMGATDGFVAVDCAIGARHGSAGEFVQVMNWCYPVAVV